MQKNKLVEEFLAGLSPRTQVEVRDGLKALIARVVIYAVNAERERIVKLLGPEAARQIEDFGTEKPARRVAGRKY